MIQLFGMVPSVYACKAVFARHLSLTIRISLLTKFREDNSSFHFCKYIVLICFWLLILAAFIKQACTRIIYIAVIMRASKDMDRRC